MPNKTRRIVLWSLFGLLMLLILVVALLPSLASTNPARKAILRQINMQMGKTADTSLKIERWSLGWFHGLTADGIDFSDSKGNMSVQIAHIAAPIHVFSLLGATKDLGHIEIDKPTVALNLPDEQQTGSAAPSVSEPEPPKEAKGKKRDVKKPLPDIKLKFDLRDGNIRIKTPKLDNPLEVTDLNISLDVPSLNKPLTFSIESGFGKAGGGFVAKGTAKVLTDGFFKPDGVSADGTLKINQFPLGVAITAAKAVAPAVPESVGTLDADVSFKMDGLKKLEAKGLVGTRGLAMKGGALGPDSLSLDKVSLEFDIGEDGDTLSIRKCRLVSPIATVRLGGDLKMPAAEGAYPDGSIVLGVGVDIAAVAKQLPNTLKLKEGMSITSGNIVLEGKLLMAPTSVNCNGSLKLDNLAGLLNGRKISLDAPVALTATASTDKNGPKLDSFTLNSSFMTGSGGGNLDKMDLNLAIDLSKALAEARKFMDLGDLAAAGRAGISVAVNSPDANSKQVRASLTLNDLQISKGGMRPVTEKQVDLKLGTLLHLDGEKKLKDLSDTSINLRTSFITAGIVTKQITLPAGGGLPAMDVKIRATSDLSKILDLASGIATNIPADMKVAGMLELACDASVREQAVSIPLLDVKITPFSLTQGSAADGTLKKLADKEIHVTGKIEADIRKRRATIEGLALTFSPGRLTVTELVVPDWSNPMAGMKAHVDGQVDIAALMAMLDGFAALPEGTSVEGGGKISLDIEAKGEKEDVKLEGTIDNLQINSKGQPPVKESKIGISASATIEPKAANLTLQSFAVASSPLSLTLAGKLQDWKVEKNLDITGSQTIDFARVAALTAPFIGQKIEMSGKKTEPFSIKTSLKGKDWKELVRATTMSSWLEIDRIQVFGMDLAGIRIPLGVSNGMARVTVEGNVNEGKVNASPVVDVTGKQPVLRLPDNSQLILGVKLTDAIANGLLAKIHPLFGGSAVTAGNMSLEMKKLRIPLDETMKAGAEFEGKIRLQGLQLGAAGLLKQVLSEFVKESDLATVIGDQEFGFKCVKGRIYPDPLTIKSGGNRLTFRGSIGLDQTLDCYVDIPITRGMVGGDVYDYVKGMNITLPVGGTVTRPKPAKDFFQKAIGDTVKKAAGQAVQNALEKEANKALKNLFR